MLTATMMMMVMMMLVITAHSTVNIFSTILLMTVLYAKGYAPPHPPRTLSPSQPGLYRLQIIEDK